MMQDMIWIWIVWISMNMFLNIILYYINIVWTDMIRYGTHSAGDTSVRPGRKTRLDKDSTAKMIIDLKRKAFGWCEVLGIQENWGGWWHKPLFFWQVSQLYWLGCYFHWLGFPGIRPKPMHMHPAMPFIHPFAMYQSITVSVSVTTDYRLRHGL